MAQIILQWQIPLALNIQHRIVLLPTTCVLVGVESWQRGATKNGKVDDAKRQEHTRLIDDNSILKPEVLQYAVLDHYIFIDE